MENKMNELLKAIKEKFDYYYINSFLQDNYDVQEENNNNSFSYLITKNNLDVYDLPIDLRSKVFDYLEECQEQDFQDWWTFNGDNFQKEYLKTHDNDADMMIDAQESWGESDDANRCWEYHLSDYNATHNIKIEFILDEFSSHVEVNVDDYYTNDNDSTEKDDEESYSIMIEKDDLNDRMIANLNKIDVLSHKANSSSELPLDYFMDNYKVNKIAKKITFGK